MIVRDCAWFLAIAEGFDAQSQVKGALHLEQFTLIFQVLYVGSYVGTLGFIHITFCVEVVHRMLLSPNALFSFMFEFQFNTLLHF